MPQVAGARMCHYRYLPEATGSAHGGEGGLLLSGVHTLPSLQLLLEALLPAGAPLARLELLHAEGLVRDDAPLDIAALRGCSRLASLRELLVEDLSTAAGGSEAALEALLEHATQLVDLELKADDADALTSIPPCLAGQSGLTRLVLASHQLADLSQGPYLTGAGRRCCRCCCCPCCRWLMLPHLSRECITGRVGHSSVSQLSHTCPPTRLHACMHAGLRHLDLSFNQFRRLPPALRAASSLTSLNLSGCRLLGLTIADVDSTLVHLAQLVELRGSRQAGYPWALLPYLQQCMPQLRADFGAVMVEDDDVGGECGCLTCQMALWEYDSSSDDSDY